MVLDLANKYSKSNRIITADNFFISFDLAKKLWQIGLFLVGTLRKNKAEIPNEFLPNPKRLLFSCLFAFNLYVSMISYVTKKRKAVILLSTNLMHQKIEKSSEKKPEVILDYNNRNKGSITKKNY